MLLGANLRIFPRPTRSLGHLGGARAATGRVCRLARPITIIAGATSRFLRYLLGMSSRAHKVIEEFYALPEEEQSEVLEAIVPADLDDLSPEYRAELERRLCSIDDGTAVLLDGDEVLARLRLKLAQR